MDNQANYAIELRELTKTFGEAISAHHHGRNASL